jgi:hypothetical protein
MLWHRLVRHIIAKILDEYDAFRFEAYKSSLFFKELLPPSKKKNVVQAWNFRFNGLVSVSILISDMKN